MALLQYENIKAGDIITFGHYPQKTEEREPIYWKVLEVFHGKAFIISNVCLEERPYNHKLCDTTWETCSLRQWLNEEFFENAFCEDEKCRILECEIQMPPNPEYGMDSGNPTKDKLFLLSSDEAYHYFSNLEERIAGSASKGEEAGEKGVNWWTRTVGRDRLVAAHVYGCGAINNNGADIADERIAVRPAMYIKIDSAQSEPALKKITNWRQRHRAFSERSKAEPGDRILFGAYQQSARDERGPEPIEWIVLDNQEDSLLIISKYVLEPMAVNEAGRPNRECATWETCSLRQWLNEEFYYKAFSENERAYIKETWITNPENPEFGTECGSDTLDKIFILSAKETDLYFPDNESRRVKPTGYAVNKGAFIWTEQMLEGLTEAWTRTLGQTPLTNVFVYTHGGIEVNGYSNADTGTGCRPALYLKKGEIK